MWDIRRCSTFDVRCSMFDVRPTGPFMPDLPSVAQRYRAALREFVASRSEAALQTAYEVGREAIAAGWGILDMMHLHQDAQIELLASDACAEGGLDLEEAARAACAMLAESLSPFEMTHRGFREAYATLRQSEARYRSLVDNAPYGIGRCGADGHFTSANPALARMLGYDSEAELLGLDPATAIHQAGPGDYGRLLAEWLRPGEHRRASEIEWTRRDGASIRVQVTARAVTGPRGGVEGAELIVEDVTEQRELEERLRLAQKMEAVGQLAGGIAHDFNNFITGITLCNHILARGLPEGDPRRRQVEEIDVAATRASLLTQRLLAFARRQVVQPRVLDLSDVVAGMSKLLHPLLGDDVKLATDLARGPCTVHADSGQLEQVVMNLAVNARDAMPNGGTVTIETRLIEPGQAAVAELGTGRWVSLAVTDTGVGMDADTQARIFDPFFTTKEPGRGTGLGLSTVYGIVTQWYGHVRVRSAQGQGSTFVVYLPMVSAVRLSPVGLKAVTAEFQRASGTVLLAEDDEVVGHGIRAALEEIGYAVLAAASGEEALAIARAHTGAIPLLVTDLVMPGMGGRALAEHFLTLHPEGRVLYVSGYAGDAMMRRGLSVPETQFLQKPFTADALIRKVAEVLSGGVTPAASA
jgi:PAS domain S-box-containing protein